MRVLLVEDDGPTAQAVELMLESAGHNVDITKSGETGTNFARWYNYDVMLLNVGLPDMSGFDVLKKLRAARVTIPIVMLTRRAGIEDKIHAFGLGADDYITKPFHKDELLARMNAIVRRSQGRVVQTAK